MSRSINPQVKTYFSDYNAKMFIAVAIQCDILFCPTDAEDHLITCFQWFMKIRIIQPG